MKVNSLYGVVMTLASVVAFIVFFVKGFGNYDHARYAKAACQFILATMFILLANANSRDGQR